VFLEIRFAFKVIKALVFDVFGTLLDTKGYSVILMKEVLEKCKCSKNPEIV
jgi:phosphoglycolate phosphatase-like HAD superfamily hydrolase